MREEPPLTPTSSIPVPQGWASSLEELLAVGRGKRQELPRSAHAFAPATGRDPIALLEASNSRRLPELVPIRHGRMAASPFAFFRGAAAVMAHDLASQPHTGLMVQACGDAHLLNFGLFATPERNLVFDLNDFDETHPAPWEWDVKRLATSAILAARQNRLAPSQCQQVARTCLGAYRRHLHTYVRKGPLEVWYARVDAAQLLQEAPSAAERRRREVLIARAQRRDHAHTLPKITTLENGRCRFLDQPPWLSHAVAQPGWQHRALGYLHDYCASLPLERQTLVRRYRLEDMVNKVVGVGSVGLRCYLLLAVAPQGETLILQAKEAQRSVLEPYTAPSPFQHMGERVVSGQRLLQSSSDLFLGSYRSSVSGREYYIRQLRDQKLAFPLLEMKAESLSAYVELCGRTLARAHCKGGEAAPIAGYLGSGERFDEACLAFAEAYANQTESDHAALCTAVATGRLQAIREDR